MYIKLVALGEICWHYEVYAANHSCVMIALNTWSDKPECIRAAKKMARRLGIEYREVK